jgi:tRNA modification GTPase
MNDTIAAIATAGGSGTIAIVRLSGPEARQLAATIAPKASFTPRQADLATLYDRNGAMIDQGIVLFFASPRSFTGEDVVEFQSHGGVVIARQILDALLEAGARLAEPGEFTKRAFLGGKIDLSQAEAIAGIIEAKSVRGTQILARQLQGELGEFVDATREALLRILAHSEVMIDYAEEVESPVVEALTRQLEELREHLERTVRSSQRRRGLIEGFRVAIVGKPNVGKSSLLNAMLAYDRAIVSPIAGTTRDTIEETIEIGSHHVRLIDTAGIRSSEDTIEQIGVERSLASLQEADIVVALFDASRPWDGEDRRIADLLEVLPPENVLVVINKVDLPSELDRSSLTRWPQLELSVAQDAEPLIARLETLLDQRGDGEEPMLVSQRQMEAVRACAEQIMLAYMPLEQGELELFSYHIREAIDRIGSITHPYEESEMLDRMFGEFCLGK